MEQGAVIRNGIKGFSLDLVAGEGIAKNVTFEPRAEGWKASSLKRGRGKQNFKQS